MENEDAIENQRLMKLEQDRVKKNANQKENQPEQGTGNKGPFINGGEAALLLTFSGLIDVIQWIFDFIPFIGWAINVFISLIIGGILMIWTTGKVAKGAPKSWYKAIYWGAVGGAIPIIPGYLGAIIYLLMQDRKIFGEIGTKIIEKARK